MGRRNRLDFFRDRNEHVEHNFHDAYWFNKIDSYILAKWRANLAVSVIESIIFTIALVLVIMFSIADGKAQTVLLVILGVGWIITTLRAMRWFALKKAQKPVIQRPKERKKKLPKRPKNYH